MCHSYSPSNNHFSFLFKIVQAIILLCLTIIQASFSNVFFFLQMLTSAMLEAIFVMTFVRIPRVVSAVTAGQDTD